MATGKTRAHRFEEYRASTRHVLAEATNAAEGFQRLTDSNKTIYQKKDELFSLLIIQSEQILDKAEGIESKNGELSNELIEMRASFNRTITNLTKFSEN